MRQHGMYTVDGKDSCHNILTYGGIGLAKDGGCTTGQKDSKV